MIPITEEEIEKEDARLLELWVNSDSDISEIVEKYATPQYKKYYKEEKLRQKKMLEEDKARA